MQHCRYDNTHQNGHVSSHTFHKCDWFRIGVSYAQHIMYDWIICIIHTWIKPCSRVYFWWSVCPTNNTWHIHRVFEDSASIFGVVCLDDDDWLATQLYPCRFTNNPPYILWPYNYSRIAYDLLWSSRLNPAPIILGERHGFIVFQFHVFF